MYERMLDKRTEPTLTEMTAHCGAASTLFTALNDWLSDVLHTERSTVFPYGDRYGWGIAHKRKGRLVCNVFPEDGALCVMLRLTNAQWASVYENAREPMRACVDGKYPCGDGGWIHYRVVAPEDMPDIRRALEMKCG